jgi:hypothetical protein
MYFKAINRFHSMFVNFLIGCLKFHMFIFAMPIVQVIVFLYLEMCYEYVTIFICPTFTHLYPNDIYRGNVEIFVLGPLPCDQGKCLSFTFTYTWIKNSANFM